MKTTPAGCHSACAEWCDPVEAGIRKKPWGRRLCACRYSGGQASDLIAAAVDFSEHFVPEGDLSLQGFQFGPVAVQLGAQLIEPGAKLLGKLLPLALTDVDFFEPELRASAAVGRGSSGNSRGRSRSDRESCRVPLPAGRVRFRVGFRGRRAGPKEFLR